jgi:hypothetical protein
MIKHKILNDVEVKWLKLNEDYKHAFLQAIDSYVNKAHYIIEHEYKASIKETKRSNVNLTAVVPAEINL